MLRRWLLAVVLALMATSLARAAYIPTGTTVLQDPAGQPVGVAQPNNATPQPTIPLITQPANPYAPVPSPPPSGIQKWGGFWEALGRPLTLIWDGVYNLVFAPPNGSPAPGQPAAVVNLSPNPAMQCPYTAPVNQTASATIITNPGGKAIHVCGILLVSATQQGISVAEGTGTACATNPVYWDGGSGGTLQAAANGGYGPVSFRIIYPMQKAGDNVCVIQSGVGNVSGHINYGVFSQ